MLLEECNAFLEGLALLNDGVNHSSSYVIESLPSAASLAESLGLHFSSISTSNSPPQPAESWQIRIAQLPGNWDDSIAGLVRRWLFQQDFSPQIEDWKQQNVVQTLLSRMKALFGCASAFKIEVSPPLWYECVWEDVAIETGNNRWLVHFGFSD